MLTTPAVTVEERDLDRYGRVVAQVGVDGTDLSAEMVRQGFAWHDKRYSDDTRLAALEVRARAGHLGLWSVSNPVAPWDYRHGSQPNEVLAAAAGKPSTSPQATPVKFTCGGKRRCGDMDSCEEAYFYLNQCGVRRLDDDGDGVPCEKIC